MYQKRCSVEKRRCIWCNKPLIRKRYMYGPLSELEPLADWLIRVHCGRDCYLARRRHEAKRRVTGKNCLYCNKPLQRSVYPNGRLEAWKIFCKRKFCGRTHALAHKKFCGKIERAKKPWLYRCKIEGCNREATTKGWCGKHYWRFWKYGDPLVIKTRHKGGSGKYELTQVEI